MSAALQHSILLVEDNPDDVDLLRARLSAAQMTDTFSLDAANSLENGLRKLSENHYDLVLLDLMLPDSEGIDTFERFYQRQPSMPIVVLTGVSQSDLGPKLIALGAQDFIEKDRISIKGLGQQLAFAMGRRDASVFFQKRIQADSIYWLAETISGEFNHLLSDLMSNINSVEPSLRDDPEALASARRAADQALAGADIIHLLLTLSRPPSSSNRRAVNAVIDELVPSLRQQFGQSVNVRVADDVCRWQTQFDDTQIRTIIATLVSNAVQQVRGNVDVFIRAAQATDPSTSDHGESATGFGPRQMVSLQISAKDALATKTKAILSFLPKPGHRLIKSFIERSGGEVFLRTHPVMGVSIEIQIPRFMSFEDRQTEVNLTGRIDVRSKNVVAVGFGGDASGGIVEQISILGYRCSAQPSLEAAVTLAASGIRTDMIVIDAEQIAEDAAHKLLADILDYSFESRLLVVCKHEAPSTELLNRLPMPATVLVAPESLSEIDSGLRNAFYAGLQS